MDLLSYYPIITPWKWNSPTWRMHIDVECNLISSSCLIYLLCMYTISANNTHAFTHVRNWSSNVELLNWLISRLYWNFCKIVVAGVWFNQHHSLAYMIRNMTAVSCLILIFVCVASVVKCEIFTSLAHMQRSLFAERDISIRIKNYVEEEKERLDALSR